jgi:uncharacterized protein
MNCGGFGWLLKHDDVDEFADGCALLGSGGGGNPYCFSTVLKELVAVRGPVRVLSPADLARDAVVVNVSFVGAPVVMTEKLLCEDQVRLAVDAMARRLGSPIHALIAAEIGGANGLLPMIAASLLDLPVVDADGMGRAFPMSDQVTYSIYGRSASPTIVTTEHGDVVCIDSKVNRRVELLQRALSQVNGNLVFTTDYVLSAEDVRDCAVLGSVSLALRLGRALKVSREAHSGLLTNLAEALTPVGDLAVKSIFDGKIIDCPHETRSGWTFGNVKLASLPEGSELTLDYQNEFLVARRGEVPVATTPDIISLLDSDTLGIIATDSVRYGQRVKVLAIEAPQLLRTAAALEVVGPQAFGYSISYCPVSRPG